MPSYLDFCASDNNDSGWTNSSIDHPFPCKLRVVMGLFDQPALLISALQDLSSQGFEVTSLCVSGSPDSMAMAASLLNQRSDVDPQLASLCNHTESFKTDTATQTQVGSQGTLLRLLKKWLENPDATDGSRCAYCAGLTGALEPHTVNGRLMLTVNAMVLTHLTKATRVLLQHSNHAVEMHEFTEQF